MVTENSNELMRPEVLTPARGHRVGAALLALSMLVTGACATLLAAAIWSRATPTTVHLSVTPTPRVPPIATASAPIVEPVLPAAPEPAPAPAPEPPVTPNSGDAALVFSLDGKTYATISQVRAVSYEDETDDIESSLPQHGPFAVVGDDEFVQGAIAALTGDDLPAEITAWRGREVAIDNRCQAKVVGLSLVALASGSFGYMAEREAGTSWADHVVAHANVVIAAELRGCASDHGIARLADLPLPMLGVPVDGPASEPLIQAARAKLLASSLARAAQRDYEELGTEGPWWRAERDVIRSQIVRHPGTGDTLISLHAVLYEGCGGAEISLWGLYEVTDDSEVTELRVIDAGDIYQLGRAVDLDGDGTFEFPARTLFDDRVLLSSDGTRLLTLETPFYGCHC